MSTKVSKNLVIDASIARASGGVNATFPTSKACRDFLINTLDICHKIVMNSAIRNEWKTHQSNFARSWLRSMYAKKKVVPVSDDEDPALRADIRAIVCAEEETNAMLKDMHLVEAAADTDSTVVSLDDKVRNLFRRSSQNVGKLRPIIWVNPSIPDERSIEWLETGAPAEEERALAADH